ncbi:hypothetical protein SAY87_021335 [Trapa incisa]|uniref:Uncharacterized protein n=1 Tax=Trapa incisa TaxID=236973 RepID=A0AAN7PPS3_9MYRT|nr:hypothetical protein SAY87_021335 [Trapa incisa]
MILSCSHDFKGLKLLLTILQSTVKQTWSQPIIKGSPPTPRDSHSCTTVGDNLFVFGGTDGRNALKDLHILDTSSHTWISPSIRGEGPEARENHSATLVGKRLFIFGGCGKSSNGDELYYNDLYILNTETFVWKKAVTTGTLPSARDSHTCSSWKNKIIVIGGEDGRDYYLSDVHILDTDTLMWKQLPTTGQMLPPRAGHSTVSFGKILFVFGGFTEAHIIYDDLYMLDVEAGLWTRVATTGSGPSARFSMAGDSLDPVKAGVLIFIGGCNKSLEALDDIYFLYTGLMREHERRLEKLSLRKQLKLKCQEQNQTPGHNKALVPVGVTAGMFQPVPISIYGQPGVSSFSPSFPESAQVKKMFHAKITELLSDGYSIETVIDGKPLRGVLFSNKPSAFHMSHRSSSRKRASSEIDPITSDGDCSNKMSVPRKVSEVSGDYRQVDHTLGKNTEVAAASPPASKIAEASGASASGKVIMDQVPETHEPLANPLDSKDGQENNAMKLNEGSVHASTGNPMKSSQMHCLEENVSESASLIKCSREQESQKQLISVPGDGTAIEDKQEENPTIQGW